MGEVIKKIAGDATTDPCYQKFTVEWNQIGHAHIHHGNIRLDLDVAHYNAFYDAMMAAQDKLRRIHGG